MFSDYPLGILPNGATDKIIEAIDSLKLSEEDKRKIYYKNFEKIIKRKK